VTNWLSAMLFNSFIFTLFFIRFDLQQCPDPLLFKYSGFFVKNLEILIELIGMNTGLAGGLPDFWSQLPIGQYWSSRNITVFAFIPPTGKKMKELEKQESGFHSALFIERFRTAKGIWLATKAHDYKSYDSSHLHRDSARAFSLDLAEQIKHRRAVNAEQKSPIPNEAEQQ